MKGYKMNEITKSEVRVAMRIAVDTSERSDATDNEKSELKKSLITDLRRIQRKESSSKMNQSGGLQKALRKEDSQSKEISLTNMTIREGLDAIADFLDKEDDTNKEEDVKEVEQEIQNVEARFTSK